MGFDPRVRNPRAVTVPSEQRRWQSWPARGLCLTLLTCAVALSIGLDFSPMLAAMLKQAMASHTARWTILLIYMAGLAVPFVPGAEIGIALMFGFGPVMALPVYIATIVALSIAFAVGRRVSQYGLAQPYDGEAWTSDALAVLSAIPRTRGWLQPLVRFRCLAIIVLIDTPGNTVIGGGGGIAMAVGYSRTLTYPVFLACLALAVAPVPVAVLIAEHLQLRVRLDRWMHSLTGVSPMSTAHD